MATPANWFIALPVSAGAWFEALTPPPAGVRPFGAKDLHLTVAFLGPVSEERARSAFELAPALTLEACDVTLSKVECLGSKHKPSAFSAVLGIGRVSVESAMSEIRAAMWQRAGARHDTRPALAHVTLARPQRRITPEQLQHALDWALGLQVSGVRCRLDRVALYTWSEDRAQTLFRIADELPLSAC
jgi:RNA 2',3'-cyclic 3'-phosphodiesterase